MQDLYEDIFDDIDGPKVYYTKENVSSNDDDDYSATGCDCIPVCKPQSCTCYEKTGAHYNPTLTVTDSSKPIQECHKACKCDVECALRLVQRGPIDGLYIARTSKGYGLFTKQPVPKGRFICEYAGELLTKSEAEIRHANNKKSKNRDNYIFWLREHFGKNVIETIVDPTYFGNVGRFINHSCEPNCEIIAVRVGEVQPKLCVFTGCDVGSGEEISFDYGVNEAGAVLGESGGRTECLCGAASCRKFLPYHEG